jgi:protease-4
VDELGTERTAIAWLEKEKSLPRDLPVRDWRPSGAAERFGLWTAAAGMARLSGWEGLAALLETAGRPGEASRLDGLLAVWHPAVEK